MTEVPAGLRSWFVVHFVADMIFAVPLFLAPRTILGLFGWTEIDPLSTRLVAAALFGIGIESLLGRNADRATFRAMLNLKLIWSSTATIGILWSVLEGGPAMGWVFVAIFASFFTLWATYRFRIS